MGNGTNRKGGGERGVKLKRGRERDKGGGSRGTQGEREGRTKRRNKEGEVEGKTRPERQGER